MIRLIFLIVIFYTTYQLIKTILAMINGPKRTNGSNANSADVRNPQKVNYNIQQKDIIDADFEEIKDKEEQKS